MSIKPLTMEQVENLRPGTKLIYVDNYNNINEGLIKYKQYTFYRTGTYTDRFIRVKERPNTDYFYHRFILYKKGILRQYKAQLLIETANKGRKAINRLLKHYPDLIQRDKSGRYRIAPDSGRKDK